MVALARYIVEPNDAATVLAVEESVLEEMRACRNGLRHLPNNNLDNYSIWQDSFDRWRMIAAFLMSFMPSPKPVFNHANGRILSRQPVAM